LAFSPLPQLPSAGLEGTSGKLEIFPEHIGKQLSRRGNRRKTCKLDLGTMFTMFSA
jgi:hypothetical protein